MKYLVWLLLALGICIDAYPQLVTPVYRSYGLVDGLGSENIGDLLQDKDGFLWIATDAGVYKFDGEEFLLVSKTPTSRFVSAPDQKIWVNSGRTLTYLLDQGIAEHPMIEQIQQLAKGTLFHSIYPDSLGNVWFTIANIVVPSDPHKRLTTLYQLTPDTLLVHDFRQDPDARIIGDTCYWKLIEGQPVYTGRFRTQAIIPDRKQVFGPQVFDLGSMKGKINKMIRLQDGSYLVSTTSTLIHLDDSLVHYFGAHVLPMNHMILDIYEDREGTVWLSTFGGAYAIDNYNFRDVEKYRHFLPDKTITSTLQTEDGSYWFGTKHEGLIQMASASTLWIRWENERRKSVISHLVRDGDRIWVSSGDGYIYTMDSSMQMIQHPAPQTKGGGALVKVGDRIFSSFRWLLSETGYERISQFKGEPSPFKYYFHGLYPRNAHQVWAISQPFGIFLLDLDKQEIVYDSRKWGFSGSARTFVTDPDSIPWAIKDGDVYRMQDSAFQHPYVDYPGLASLDSSWYFTGIRITKAGTLILSSPDSGQAILHQHGIQILRPGKDYAGHSSSKVSIEDEASIWILNNQAFSHFVFDSLSQGFVNESSFSPGFSFPLGSEFYAAFYLDGKIWIFTSKGLVQFDPQHLSADNFSAPPTFITSLETNDSLYFTKRPIKFLHTGNTVFLNFRTVSFHQTQKDTIRYRLSGVDNKWQYTTDRKVQYTNLAPDTYTFEIESKDGYGVYQNQDTHLTFEIVPRLTQQIWFKVVMGLLGLLTLLAIGYGILRYQNQQSRHRSVVAELKYQTLINQMSPHFIFNAMNSIAYLVQSEQTSRAGQYLNRFAGLLRGVLEHAQQNFIPLAEELEHVRQYLSMEQLQMGDGLQFEVETEPDLAIFDLYIPPMLLQPIIENAINHGISPKGAGEILVHVLDIDNKIIIAIRDDGIGRTAAKTIQKSYVSKKEKSIGLKNTTDRITNINRMYGLDIQMWTEDLMEQGEVAGTQVEFSFPKLQQIPSLVNPHPDRTQPLSS